MFSFIVLVSVSLLSIHSSHSLPTNSQKLSLNSKLVESNNEFALNLLHILPQEDNHLFSPISLSSALLTLLNGAKGDTEKELKNIFNIEDKSKLDGINGDMKSLLEMIAKRDNGNDLDLKLANRVLVANDFKLLDNFQKTIEEDYKANVVSVDFGSNARNATKDLNEWVFNQTNGKIQRLFKDSLDSQSSLVLANAVYFNGKWKFPFDPRSTSKGDFFNGGDQLSSQINLMTTQNKFKVKSVPQLQSQFIELPFSGGDVSMIIILPDDIKGLDGVIENITLEALNAGIDGLQKSEANDLLLTIPKFKLETDYDLKEPLEELDAKSLFHETADLSGINGQKNLRVSTAIHKATVEFSEEGAEASAGTGVQLVYLSLPPSVRVDRPFLFLIRDNVSGLFLFIGRVQTLIDEELLSLGFI